VLTSPPPQVWGPPPCAIADPTWQTCQDEGWRALVEFKKAGKIKAIGVSNWMLANLKVPRGACRYS
jgi:diketogulonate reductase-like aldo/keto reductase